MFNGDTYMNNLQSTIKHIKQPILHKHSNSQRKTLKAYLKNYLEENALDYYCASNSRFRRNRDNELKQLCLPLISNPTRVTDEYSHRLKPSNGIMRPKRDVYQCFNTFFNVINVNNQSVILNSNMSPNYEYKDNNRDNSSPFHNDMLKKFFHYQPIKCFGNNLHNSNGNGTCIKSIKGNNINTNKKYHTIQVDQSDTDEIDKDNSPLIKKKLFQNYLSNRKERHNHYHHHPRTDSNHIVYSTVLK